MLNHFCEFHLGIGEFDPSVDYWKCDRKFKFIFKRPVEKDTVVVDQRCSCSIIDFLLQQPGRLKGLGVFDISFIYTIDLFEFLNY